MTKARDRLGPLETTDGELTSKALNEYSLYVFTQENQTLLTEADQIFTKEEAETLRPVTITREIVLEEDR